MFLAFNLEIVPGRPRHGHYVVIWRWNEFTLIRILPRDAFVLVDENLIYRYMPTTSRDTYIPAVRLDTHVRTEILHYRYLLDWIKRAPVVKAYPPDLSNEVEILNHVSENLT